MVTWLAVGGLTLALAGFGPAQDWQAGLREAASLAAAGDPEAARERYRELLPSIPEGAPERARALGGLGAVEGMLGDYDASAIHSQEAADLYAQLDDPGRQSTALNRTGLAHLYAGSYDPAATAFRTAIDLSTIVGNAAAHAEQVTNLGNVYFFVGSYSEAGAAYDVALALAETHRSEPWAARRRRLSLVNKATLDQRLGRHEEALAGYQALDVEDVELRPQERAQILTNLGVLYRRLGDPIKALEAYDEAARLFSLDRHLDGELGVIKNRGIVLALDLNDLDGARRSFDDALERAAAAGNRREVLHAQLYRGETFRRQGRLELAAEDFAASLTQARDLETPEEEWKALFGLGRLARALRQDDEAAAYFGDALAVIESIRENIRVPARRSDFFSDKRAVYDALIATRIDTAPVQDVFGWLERSHSRAWRDRLGLPASVELAAVQERLDPGVLLLDFWQSAEGAAVIAITHDTATLHELDVPEALVRRLIGELSSDGSDWMQAAGELSRRLLPADLTIGNDTRVLIVTDGALALVPFEVLPVGDGLLVEIAAVAYLPTSAMLLRDAPPRPGVGAPWRPTISAFADPIVPDMNGEPDAVRGRLAAAAEEARNVAAELGGAARVYTGADNRKAALIANGNAAPVLHLATHAVADSDALEQSRLMFSPADETGTADYLFLGEAYDLRLQGVELAVLSACDTALGREVHGEGVQSFSRAFLAAGARSTVTTLWRVADEPTADFMRSFYYQLRRGQPRAEALRQAKLQFLAAGGELADPYYWAAFVLTGDGAQPISRALRWRTVLLSALSVVMVGGWLVRARRQSLLPHQRRRL